MFCPNCGKQIPDGTKFCPQCGKPIPSSESLGTPKQKATEAFSRKQPKNAKVFIGLAVALVLIVGVVLVIRLFNERTTIQEIPHEDIETAGIETENIEIDVMEKARENIDRGNYAAAAELLQGLDTLEARTMLDGINCIDYANSMIEKLDQEYAMSVFMGMKVYHEYDPVTYTFFQIFEVSGIYNAVYQFAVEQGDDNPTVINEDAAEELYFDYFYPAGYTGITCTVVVRNELDEFLGQVSYSNSSSPSTNPTPDAVPSSQPNNEPQYNNDFPPTFTPIMGVGYSDYLGKYVNEDGLVLEIGVGTGGHYAKIYANQSDADNYAQPLLELVGGSMDYYNGYMVIEFSDSMGNSIYFERDNFIEDNYTLYIHGASYFDGVDMTPYCEDTFYMIEQYIDVMG